MSDEQAEALRVPPRKPRADAQRNRERILQVAKQVFSRHGAEASLDDIARQAEIGPGTLYRHFPTRDALIAAVYRTEVERLAAAGEMLASQQTPFAALRAWMLLFIDHVADKRLILPAMDTVEGGAMSLIEGTRGLIHGTFLRLIESARQSGELRPETEPDDLMRALIGVFHTTAMPGWEPSARRIVDLLLEGARRS